MIPEDEWLTPWNCRNAPGAARASRGPRRIRHGHPPIVRGADRLMQGAIRLVRGGPRLARSRPRGIRGDPRIVRGGLRVSWGGPRMGRGRRSWVCEGRLVSGARKRLISCGEGVFCVCPVTGSGFPLGTGAVRWPPPGVCFVWSRFDPLSETTSWPVTTSPAADRCPDRVGRRPSGEHRGAGRGGECAAGQGRGVARPAF